MKVVGFNFTKIHADRSSGAIVTKKISNTIQFTDIQKKTVELVKEEEIANFHFKYEVKYEPDLASISIEGILLVTLEPEKLKEILTKWKKKQLDESVKLPLLNVVLRKCTLKAFNLEEELNLSTHIPLPKVKIK